MVLKTEKIYFLSLFILFIISDLLTQYGIANILKFAFIISTYLWAVKNKKCRLGKAALLLTCVSDYFLLLTHYYTVGVFVFSAVMCTYICIFSGKNKFHVFPILLNILFLFSEYRLYLLCASYICLFYTNFYIVTKKHIKTEPVIPAAFLLFALCDIFVGLSFITENSLFPVFIWIFYAPSQYLISHYAIK